MQLAGVVAEEAVCRAHVGIARRTDLAAHSRLLAGVSLGRAVRTAAGWLARTGPERGLLIGPGSGGEPVFSVVGPRGPALLEAAGLPGALSPGEVRVCWWLGAFVVLLRESADRHLLVAPETALAALLAAGRPLEVACVGVEALARLHAASLQQQRA